MYSDFFDQIDAARNGRRGVGGRGPEATIIPEVPPLVSFKAGKVKLVEKPDSSSYQCEADPARGEVRLIWNSSDRKVQWQWYDRRNKKVVDKYYITEPGSTFERIDLSHSKKHKNDRIYLWTKTKPGDKSTYDYDMYWMQDINDEKDDEIVAQVNQYLADPDSAAPEGTTTNITTTSTDGMATPTNRMMATATVATGTSVNSSTSASQVDALSSILENLGMPPAGADGDGVGVAYASGAGGNGSTSSGGTKRLTLADLQGAMAGIQASTANQWSQEAPGPALNELVTSDAVTAILESDESVKQRLIALLPEGQQTPENLAENLRSPQVQATLRTLTQALLPDPDTGDLSGYASVIANFNLNPVDGQASLAQGNPIQAFLDCIIKSVEKDKADAADSEMKEETDPGEEKSDESKHNN